MIGKMCEDEVADEKRFARLKQKHQGFFFSKEAREYWGRKTDREIQEMDERIENGVRLTQRERMARLHIKRAVALELIARHDLVCDGCPFSHKDAVAALLSRSRGRL
jgi:hypothetical protein